MSEWWTYSLSDLLLFSPRVYYRLFELHNHALWPAHLLSVAVGLAILYALLRPTIRRLRLVLAAFGVIWIWVALAFFWQRYATINWAAVYVAPVFVVQGVMLLGTAAFGPVTSAAPEAKLIRFSGAALFALALFAYPVIAPFMGRTWSAAEVFGIAPDPTSLATLAVLAISPSRLRWLLMVIPLAWIAISTLTLLAMDAPEVWIAPVLAITALAVSRARDR